MKLRHVLSWQDCEDGVHGTVKSLPLIKSPLEEKDKSFLLLDQIHTEDSDIRDSQPQETQGTKTRFRLSSNHHQSHNNADEPHFKVHREASSIELFYDLFFVANLTTFTANHPIDDRGTLASYMGFFTLLWFTWFQTSLYDVRFSIDSVFSRVCKALHFGVMTGFAIVGPLFQTDEVERDNRAFRSLSVVMMVSRLILVIQYGTVLWFVKGYKRTILPIALLMGILFATAMIFLGMTFAYGPHKGSKAQDGWYVTVVAEAVLVLAVSSQWRLLSFKHTHLVERVGLLTLIILGEGIIGMTKSVTKIMQGTTVVTSSSIGSVICSVLIIYFLYMLYYDQIDRDRFGTIRQQIWAVLHFPLHIGILLTTEGSSEFMLWGLGVELSNWAANKAINAAENVETGQQLIDSLKETFTAVGERFTKIAPLDHSHQYSELQALNITNSSNNHTIEEAISIIQEMLTDTYAWVFENLGVEVPAKGAAETADASDQLSEIIGVFFTVFLYFFIAAGGTLVLLSVMYYFGKKHQSRAELASIAVRFIVGLGLALLGTMYAVPDGKALVVYIQRPWILPTVMLSDGLVIVVDNLLIWASNKSVSQSKEDYDLNLDPENSA